jgi:uncharacterized membrane protein
MATRRRLWLWLFAVSALFIAIADSSRVEATDDPSRQNYVVDGLALGGKVVPTSAAYRAYDCRPSEQYRDFTVCRRSRVERPPSSGPISTVTTILHSADGTVAYVNRYIEPADFSAEGIQAEVERLSSRFGARPRILTPSIQADNLSRIAIWGNLSLTQAQGEDVTILASDRSPHRGFMVDFIGNFQKSAAAGLPVYYFNGGVGFVWNASVSQQGRPALRFFAMDADRLAAARVDNHTDAPPQQTTTGPVISPWPVESPAPVIRPRQPDNLTTFDVASVEALSCDPCAADPPRDALRKNAADSLEKQKHAGAEAERYLAGIGNKSAMESYLQSCELCGFATPAKAELARLTERASRTDEEERQYVAAGTDMQKLRQYASSCTICAHMADVSEQVKAARTALEEAYSSFKVCNRTDSTLSVAVKAREDANTDMWIVKGWFNVAPQDCKLTGMYARGSIYAFARSNDGTWWGGDRTFCIRDRAFSRISLDNYKCAPDENLQKFQEIDLDQATYTWTLTLQ